MRTSGVVISGARRSAVRILCNVDPGHDPQASLPPSLRTRHYAPLVITRALADEHLYETGLQTLADSIRVNKSQLASLGVRFDSTDEEILDALVKRCKSEHPELGSSLDEDVLYALVWQNRKENTLF